MWHSFTSAYNKYNFRIYLKSQFFTDPYFFKIAYFLRESAVENKREYMQVVFVNSSFYTFILQNIAEHYKILFLLKEPDRMCCKRIGYYCYYRYIEAVCFYNFKNRFDKKEVKYNNFHWHRFQDLFFKTRFYKIGNKRGCQF